MKIGDLVKWTEEYWNSHDNWTRPRYGIIINFWGSCEAKLNEAGLYYGAVKDNHLHSHLKDCECDRPTISWFNGETYGTYREDVEVISGEEK
jgi:hypothetical protein